MSLSLVSVWSHALAALLYAVLAVWQFRNWQGDGRGLRLGAAFVATSAWGAASALFSPTHVAAQLLAITATFIFLSFMYAVLRTAADNKQHQEVRVVYFTVAAVIGLLIAVTGATLRFEAAPLIHRNLVSTAQMLSLTVAAGCLVLVHNIYAQAAPDSRWTMRLPMIGLAGMWIYDLHLNTVAYLTASSVADLYAMRGAILALLTPLFALRVRQQVGWRIRLSRAAAFQSISALAILAYLLLMMSAARILDIIGGEWARLGQLGLVFGTSIVALVLLPSRRARSWLRVMLVKHVFQHRYDYREEWLRFTSTMAVGGDEAGAVEDRVLKAFADIAEAPAALLVLPDADYRLSPSTGWNWPRVEAHGQRSDAALAHMLEETGHIVEFDRGRSDEHDSIVIPEWMLADGFAWCGVPLVHNERLIGIVLLAHPPVRRSLDWEDLDLFRTAGQQAASYLAEARSHHALADIQRFDEFNRRFAFIMHDIKNLVSQLSLVARNAERHAENPEFRADMIATLQSSVKKMNDLLARLSRDSAADAKPARPVSLHSLVAVVVAAKKRAHPLSLAGSRETAVLAAPGRLEQAVAHLVQNAIDASPATEAVVIDIFAHQDEGIIVIADRGPGMSAEFIRTRLFQPFSSTKDGGFGIGAYEALCLIKAMGGRVDVESRVGEGTRFTISLPLARAETHQPERMRA